MRARMRNFRMLLLVQALWIFNAPPAHAASDLPSSRAITIRQCVEIALRNNIDIAVARAEKEIGEAGVPIEEAAFLPRFTGDLGTSRSIAPSGSVLDGSLALDQRVFNLDIGARELLRGGTALSLAFENRRQETSTSIALLSPEYLTALTLSAQQPLLKNRGRQVTEGPYLIARAGAAAKTAEWSGRVMDSVASTRYAFLSFLAATREADVRKSAVDLADRLMAETDARIDAGAAAPMDRLPAEAAAASRKEEWIRAEAAARAAADDQKTVLGLRSSSEWMERLEPVPLQGDASPPGEDETLEEALRRRPEVAAQAERRKQAEIQEAVSRNRTLPSLDLTVTGGLSGLAGSPTLATNPLFPVSSTAFAGNYRDSLDQMLSGRYYNWFVGLKTELPWRFDREKAEWARARSTLEQQRLLEEGLILKIRAEVRKGRRDLESALERISASRASVAAASKKLEAEEQKLALGKSTTIEVLRSQQDLSEARLAEVRAQMDAYAAQTRLWRAVGVLLDKEGIAIR